MANDQTKFDALVARIKNNTLRAEDFNDLGVLDLQGWGLKDYDIESLADALSTNTTVLCLDISDNKFGNRGWKALSKAMENNMTLIDLAPAYESKRDARFHWQEEDHARKHIDSLLVRNRKLAALLEQVLGQTPEIQDVLQKFETTQKVLKDAIKKREQALWNLQKKEENLEKALIKMVKYSSIDKSFSVFSIASAIIEKVKIGKAKKSKQERRKEIEIKKQQQKAQEKRDKILKAEQKKQRSGKVLDELEEAQRELESILPYNPKNDKDRGLWEKAKKEREEALEESILARTELKEIEQELTNAQEQLRRVQKEREVEIQERESASSEEIENLRIMQNILIEDQKKLKEVQKASEVAQNSLQELEQKLKIVYEVLGLNQRPRQDKEEQNLENEYEEQVEESQHTEPTVEEQNEEETRQHLVDNQASFDALVRRIESNKLQAGDINEEGVLDLKRWKEILTDSNIGALFRALKTNNTILSIDISYKVLGIETLEVIASTLEKNNTIIHLVYHHNAPNHIQNKNIHNFLISNRNFKAVRKQVLDKTPKIQVLLEAIKDHRKRLEKAFEENKKAIEENKKAENDLREAQDNLENIKSEREGALKTLRKTHAALIKTRVQHRKVSEEIGEAVSEEEKLKLAESGLTKVWLELPDTKKLEAAISELDNSPGKFEVARKKLQEDTIKLQLATDKLKVTQGKLKVAQQKLKDAVIIHQTQHKALKKNMEEIKRNLAVIEIKYKEKLEKIQILQKDLKTIQEQQENLKASQQREQQQKQLLAVIQEKEALINDKLMAQIAALEAKLAGTNLGINERKTMSQELEKLIAERTKALKAELKRLAATTVSQSEWEAADHKLEELLVESTNAKQEREKILKDLKTLERIAKSNAQFLADIDKNFLQPHGATLATISEQHQQEYLEQAKLAKVLKHPGALLYYNTLVSGMNNLYLASSVSTTGYITVKNKGVLKKVSTVLEGIGKLVPTFGQYIEAGAKVLDALGLHYTKEKLKNFSKLADSPEEMNALVKEIAYQLVLKNPEALTNKQAKAHLRKMINAVFNGKMEEVKDKQKLIHNLLNAAEGRDIAAERTMAESSTSSTKTQQQRNIVPRENTQVALPSGFQDTFTTPQNNQSQFLEVKIQGFLQTNKACIFEDTPLLSETNKSDIQTFLGAALYQQSKSRAGFAKALLDPTKVRSVRSLLCKSVKETFERKNVSNMTEHELGALARTVSEKLAETITPQQEQRTTRVRKIGGGF